MKTRANRISLRDLLDRRRRDHAHISAGVLLIPATVTHGLAGAIAALGPG
jgi:hypothetical protein